jgi:hypothetical protein
MSVGSTRLLVNEVGLNPIDQSKNCREARKSKKQAKIASDSRKKISSIIDQSFNSFFDIQS